MVLMEAFFNAFFGVIAFQGLMKHLGSNEYAVDLHICKTLLDVTKWR